MQNPADLTRYGGLSSAEARRRLTADGYNELPSPGKRGLIWALLNIFKEPMVLLLLACAGIYLVLGDVTEGIVMLLMVFVVTGIEFYQTRKAEKTIESLRSFSSPRALVIRDNTELRIPGREVVKDDVIIVREGDRIPADAVVLFELNLKVDESLLTGESEPVTKAEARGNESALPAGGDDLPFIYSGSLVVQGQAIARVSATGIHTQIGLVGKLLASVEPGKSRLQKETGRIVKIFAAIGFSVCAVIVASLTWQSADFLKGLLAGITLALAVLPEEFPVALTIFLAMGAWRISRNNVLTREPAALEILGSASILCSDKTGTITRNQMVVSALVAEGTLLDTGNWDMLAAKPELPEEFHGVMEYALLASQTNAFDPMEKAILSFGKTSLAETEHLHENWSLIKEYPLTRELLTMARVFKSQEQNQYVIAAKGAPEAIFDLCHLDTAKIAEQELRLSELTRKGLRVIAVARAVVGKGELPEIQHDFDFELLGLIAFKDPVRTGVPEAIRECHGAGIGVLMITGDHPATASHIAAEIGLPNPQNVITGPELASLDTHALAQRMRDSRVFARVMPEQKIQIVQALKKLRETVIMTGDGVNDAPALKAADIGIAMGGKGTDVAREAASLVLLNDDFTSIVGAIRLGRGIFLNLQKAFSYILATHFPIAILSLVPVFFPQQAMLLLPMHIVFLEIIIDPACTMIFEAEKTPEVMRMKVRSPSDSLFGLRQVTLSVLQGLFVSATVLGVYALARHSGRAENVVRALTFSTLVFSNIFLILTNLSLTRSLFSPENFKNTALKYIGLAAIGFLLIALFVPAVGALFKFAPPDMADLGLSLMAALFSVLWFEVYKILVRNRLRA